MSLLSTSSAELGLRLSNFCDTVEKELVSRCIKVFRFEPHSQRKVLLIHGEVTVTVIIPATGRVKHQTTEHFKKPICLLGLSNSINSEKIAVEILTMCPFIDDSMLPHLIEVIQELKLRDYDQNGVVVQTETAADGSFLPRFPEFFDDIKIPNDFNDSCHSIDNEEEPDFAKLDHYVELLYEEIPSKIEASRCLSKLSQCNSYLKDISGHDSALNALFRVLREDSKKSCILTKHILSICWNLAKISDFHGLLITHKIPMLTLEIIDFELERCEKWKLQLMESNSCHAMWVRLTELTAFQNGFLHIAFQILYCLSEDKRVRECLVQHKVISSLSDALERRDNNDLFQVATAYLRNLSSYRQCIDEILAVGVVEKLAALLKEGIPIPKRVVGNALHLFYNLSFCGQLCQKICDSGLVAIIANCFDKPLFREITVKTLYVISMNPPLRVKLTKAPLIDSLMSYLTTDILEANGTTVVVASLLLNLSRSKRGAKLIWETGKLGSLIKGGLQTRDFLTMKIIHSLAQQGEDAPFILVESAEEIAKTMSTSDSQEFVSECNGILGCLDLSQGISVESLILKGKIFPWLKQTLGYYLDKLSKPAQVPVTFDLTRASISVILLLNNLCSVEEGARLVVGEGFLDTLLKIVVFGSKNTESLLEHAFLCFESCTKFESISIFLASKSRFANGLLEFAEASTTQGKFRERSIRVLEQIGDFDATWKENVQQFNFLGWNKAWIDSVTEQQQDDVDDQDGGDSPRDHFRFGEDSCARSRDAICSLANNLNSTDDDEDDDQDEWIQGDDDQDDDAFEMFRLQFEKETGMHGSNDWRNDATGGSGGEFWLESHSDSESDGDMQM